MFLHVNKRFWNIGDVPEVLSADIDKDYIDGNEATDNSSDARLSF